MALDLSVASSDFLPLDLSGKVVGVGTERGCMKTTSCTMAYRQEHCAGNARHINHIPDNMPVSWCIRKKLKELEKRQNDQIQTEQIHFDCNDRNTTNGERPTNELQRLNNRINARADITNPYYCLPTDPREWTKEDVHYWLTYTKAVHDIPEIFPERFAMNGKALCLMTMDMFRYRVPLGGKLLYKDFRLRLITAMAETG